jgi:broad specificity phosphatase PhoE
MSSNAFLKDLHGVDDPTPLIGLIRHSVRHSIQEATLEAANETPLTDEGRALARTFGRQLPSWRRVRLRHSPVPRCGDTARCIAEGAAEAGCDIVGIGEWSMLGGEFIRDPSLVVSSFGRLGPRGFFRAWRAGELGAGALMSLPDAAAEVKRLLLVALGQEDGPVLDLHVSHDVVVLVLLAAACDVTAPGVPWPGYLEGVLLTPREGRLHWRYHQRSFETER